MFFCDRCGLCCRNISHILQLKEFDNGDGICRYLLPNNLCAIYNNRPEVCRVDVMYERYYKLKISKTEFYKINAEICDWLKKHKK